MSSTRQDERPWYRKRLTRIDHEVENACGTGILWIVKGPRNCMGCGATAAQLKDQVLLCRSGTFVGPQPSLLIIIFTFPSCQRE